MIVDDGGLFWHDRRNKRKGMEKKCLYTLSVFVMMTMLIAITTPTMSMMISQTKSPQVISILRTMMDNVNNKAVSEYNIFKKTNVMMQIVYTIS